MTKLDKATKAKSSAINESSWSSTTPAATETRPETIKTITIQMVLPLAKELLLCKASLAIKSSKTSAGKAAKTCTNNSTPNTARNTASSASSAVVSVPGGEDKSMRLDARKKEKKTANNSTKRNAKSVKSFHFLNACVIPLTASLWRTAEAKNPWNKPAMKALSNANAKTACTDEGSRE